MTALGVKGLNKSFGGLRVTSNVTLDVAPGERRLIIGPNGAGKTTLFNLITGDLTADAGSVRLFGQELMGMPTQQRVHLGLARTYQILTLFPRERLVHVRVVRRQHPVEVVEEHRIRRRGGEPRLVDALEHRLRAVAHRVPQRRMQAREERPRRPIEAVPQIAGQLGEPCQARRNTRIDFERVDGARRGHVRARYARS